MSCLDMLDMSEHMSRHVRTRWTQVPCMRKYALETSPGADCENMRSAKIILSPYDPRTQRETCTLSHTTHGRSSYRAVRSVSSPERARATEGGTHGTTNGRPSHTPFLVEKCMGTQVMPFGSVLVRTVGSPGASRTDAMMSR